MNYSCPKLSKKNFREKTGSGNSGKNPNTKFWTFEVCFGNLTTICTHLCRIFKVSFLFSLILTFWQKLFQRLYAWFFSKNHLRWMSWIIWINKSEWSQKYFFCLKGLSPVCVIETVLKNIKCPFFRNLWCP